MAAALIGMGVADANALSMGKLRVQSALGQSLVAEIDLADISDDEANSIKSELAAPSAFTGMGLEYNAALSGTQVVVQRRANGSRYLKVTGSRNLNDPFVDLLVELSWASGKIVRTYTILLDPPKSQESLPTPLLPSGASGDTPASATKASSTQTANSASAPANAAAVASAKTASPSVAVSASTATGQQRIRVKNGDNAGKFARAWATDGVSVEQMLIAMLDTNPSAFVGGNVNRLLANTEIVIPDSTTAKKTSPSEAQRQVRRQYQDFQNLRRTLASQASEVPANPKQSEAGGKVSPTVPASNPKIATNDTLKLSKGSSQDLAEKANMEQIAQQRAKNEATERARELAKNIEELNQLAKVAAKPEAAGASGAPAAVASNAAPDLSAVKEASTASKPLSPAVVAAIAKPAKPPSDGLWDSIIGNPEVSALVLALIGLFGGLGLYRKVQSKKSDQDRIDPGSKWNSSASTSFTVGGAQRVDTSEMNLSGTHSSMYQESQLEMANELDPVAEAEVYLAYGKDVPAEEILKEGLQHDPNRVAIHLKLLAIYAKRGDARSFESMARKVHSLTNGSGSDWALAMEMGLALDPTNPLYGASVNKPSEANSENAGFQNSIFNLEQDDLQALSSSKGLATQQAPEQLKAPTTAALPLPFGTLPSGTAHNNGTYDSSAISLDKTPIALESAFATTERLDATLALAEQFLEIGEKEGARALIEEVLAGGNETLRKRATELLAKAR